MPDEAHHVRAKARLPMSNAVVDVFLGERLDGTVGWTVGRPDPFPTRARATAYLARFRQHDFEWRLVKDSERVVPAREVDAGIASSVPVARSLRAVA